MLIDKQIKKHQTNFDVLNKQIKNGTLIFPLFYNGNKS